MMTESGKSIDVEMIILSQWIGQNPPLPGLLEQRVLELEGLGMLDAEDMPGVPSSIRQFAIASLQHTKPPYFITYDPELLTHRDALETRYGLAILSVHEAMLLLRATDGPTN